MEGKINNIKVSIIIPVYNVEKYVSRCLESVINQTLKEIEIIIVNDETKDNSYKICEEYKTKDNRIKLFSKTNEGLGLTRNYGIERANGKYLAFLDSDDYVELDFYEKLFNNIEKNNTDAVFGNIKLHTYNNEIIQRDKIVFSEKVISSQKYMYNLLHVKDKSDYKNNYMGMCVWRSLYKNEIIKNNNIRFLSERKFISEDILFNIDYCMHSKTVSLEENAYYYYCYNGDSLTKKYKADRFEKDIILYKEIIRKLKEYNKYDKKVEKGVDSLFMEYVRGVIKQEVCNSNKTKIEIMDAIYNITNNEYVKKAIKNCKNDNKKKKIINFCIRNKLTILLYNVYKF